LTFDLYKNGALLVLVLSRTGDRGRSAYATRRGARRRGCASAVALLANPLEFVRSVELPLVPVVVILATFALAVLVRAVRGQEARGAGAP